MSAWRREALERLPEYRRVIEEAKSPMALWIELLVQCQDACERRQEDLVGRFYGFAHWCWQSPSPDVRTAVACTFYEHLPTDPILRQDLPRRISRETFNELRAVFAYHLSPEEMAKLEERMKRKDEG